MEQILNYLNTEFHGVIIHGVTQSFLYKNSVLLREINSFYSVFETIDTWK